MNLPQIREYFRTKVSALKGKTQVIQEAQHCKVMIDIPKFGTHIFYLPLHKEHSPKTLDEYYEKALKVLYAHQRT